MFIIINLQNATRTLLFVTFWVFYVKKPKISSIIFCCIKKFNISLQPIKCVLILTIYYI